MMAKLILILGGARGGKSSYAQRLAQELGGENVLFVATAEGLDEEMTSRIAAHQAERPAGWSTLEAPTLVGAPLVERAAEARVVVVDCMTMLASNALLAADVEGDSVNAEAAVQREVNALLAAVESTSAAWIVVTNEVGLGLVPDNLLGRVYRDALGRANQRLAAAADEAILMVAGLPLRLK
jgi:adenosylcobinamide kinase/adenosylcobinamide-phosphate guanylyltransferase